MIDGIKLFDRNKPFADQVSRNTVFDFTRVVSESTGEMQNKSIAKYRGLKITLYDSGAVEIDGSLHKFWNKGEHNHNDYALIEVFNTLYEMTSIFGSQILSMPLRNVEIGLNITPPINTATVLESLVLHKRAQIKSATFNNSDFREAAHQRYYVKIYDKGLQYKQPTDILRIENKCVKMNELNALGLHTLTDLLNIEIYPKLKAVLLATWKDVLLIDPTIKETESTPKQRAKLKDWENPRYWLTLSRNEKSYLLNKEIDKYRNLIVKYSDNIHGQILTLLTEKWQKLTDFPAAVLDEKRQKLTDFLENTPKAAPCIRLEPVQSKKTAKINPLYTRLIFANKKNEVKKCKVTGLDISMQKDESVFLCTTGIKFYKEHCPEVYNELKKRLSPK